HLTRPPADQVPAIIKPGAVTQALAAIEEHLFDIAKYHVPFGLRKRLTQESESSGRVLVIGVQPANDFATRCLEPFIKRIRLPAVGFGNPLQMRILFENVESRVSRTVIINKMLEIVRALSEHGLNCAFYVSALIVRRRYYREVG